MYLNTMRIDIGNIQFSNYTLPTHLNTTDANGTRVDLGWLRVNLILGGDPFLTYETPY